MHENSVLICRVTCTLKQNTNKNISKFVNMTGTRGNFHYVYD